jgi:uncharacterized membrane protein
VGLVITSPFALAYYDAYALAHERPARWLAALRGQAVGLWMVIAALILVTTGTFADYALPAGQPIAYLGFVMVLLGFLLLALASPVVAVAAHRQDASSLKAAGLALLAPGAILLGMVAVGHIPSGPAAPLMVGATVAGVTHRW